MSSRFCISGRLASLALMLVFLFTPLVTAFAAAQEMPGMSCCRKNSRHACCAKNSAGPGWRAKACNAPCCQGHFVMPSAPSAVLPVDTAVLPRHVMTARLIVAGTGTQRTHLLPEVLFQRPPPQSFFLL